MDVVVAEGLEDPVLRRQQVQRRAVGGEVLDDRVLRDVERVARADLVPGRLLGDARVVLLRDLRLHLPVQRVALAVEHVEDLVGHLPVLAGPAAGRDRQLEDVDAELPVLRHLGGVHHPHPAHRRGLPDRVLGGDDLLAVQHARSPDQTPLRAVLELVRPLDRAAAALLDQAEEHPRALGLHDQRDGLLPVRVEVPVHRVGVHEDQVALLPVVALVVVDLVAAARRGCRTRPRSGGRGRCSSSPAAAPRSAPGWSG